MTRTILTTNHGEDMLRHTVRIEANDLLVAQQGGLNALVNLMQTACQQPFLMCHGFDCPESVRFYHDGASKWVLEATATVPRPKTL